MSGRLVVVGVALLAFTLGYAAGVPLDPTFVSAAEVCAARCIVVTLNDWCLCLVDGRERLIDLSDEAFAELAPLSAGLVAVTVARR